MHHFPRHLNSRSNISVRADYSNASTGGVGDFVAGFLLGGAVLGTLGYIFAPQIRRSFMNEDEYGFERAKQPAYYDEGLEKTRHTLNHKVCQLNSAIDNVSSHLKAVIRAGKIKMVQEPGEAVDSQTETSM